MPDLATIIASIIAALGGGATVAVTRRRPVPGTVDDHEERLDDHSGRIVNIEIKMAALEANLASAIERLSESNDRVWKAIDAAGETLTAMRDQLTKLDIKTTIERELRRHIATREPTKP